RHGPRAPARRRVPRHLSHPGDRDHFVSDSSGMPELRDDQLERYSRHLVLGEIGPAGQRRLLSSSVLILGVGGLGSPAAMYLGASGVGRIGLIDGDRVDLS